MKISEVYRHRDSIETVYIDLGDEEGHSASVKVDFEYEVEPTEYEGGYVFYQGGAVLNDAKVQPFTFAGKSYMDVTPELAKYIDFESGFEKKWKSEIAALQEEDPEEQLPEKEIKDLLDAYFDYLFEKYVADEVEPPVRRYPATR